jgi:hypothetical protein
MVPRMIGLATPFVGALRSQKMDQTAHLKLEAILK